MTRRRSGLIWKGVAQIGSLFALGISVLGLGQPLYLHFTQEPGQIPVSAQVWQTTYDQGQALYNAGKYTEAYKVWGEALKQAEIAGADQGDGVEQIGVLKRLALLYKTQAQHEKAAQMYEKAVAIATKNFGAISPQVAQLFLELGRVYTYDAKNYAKANEALEEAFRINEKLYGRESIPTGDVAMALGSLRQLQNRYEDAVKYWVLVVRIGNVLEPNSISCCRIGPRQQLAKSYMSLGRYEEALAVDRELLEMVQKGAPNMEATVKAEYELCLKKLNEQN